MAVALKRDDELAQEESYPLPNKADKPFALFNIDEKDLAKKAAKELDERGCVILRGILSPEQLKTLQDTVAEVTGKPSLGGSFGYYMKDCAKKLYDPLLLCEEAVHAIVDERMLDCITSYVGDEVVLAEVFMKQDLGINDLYFPLHADFQEGGKWAGNEQYPTTREIMQAPFAVGGIMYLADSTEGAFCYSDGTHKWGAPAGKAPENYPADVQQKIYNNTIRVDGKAGDVVLFDDRGFHGPDQPTTAQRTVLIFDYTKQSTFGRVVKSPAPVLLPYLKNLSPRQLDALGANCDINVPYENHHTRAFGGHLYYKILSKLYEGLFALDRMKRELRNKIKGQQVTRRAKTFERK